MDLNEYILERIKYIREKLQGKKDFFSSLNFQPGKPDKLNAANYLLAYKDLLELNEICNLYLKLNPNDQRIKSVTSNNDKEIRRLEKILISHMA